MQSNNSNDVNQPTRDAGGKAQAQGGTGKNEPTSPSSTKHKQFSDWGASPDSKSVKGPDPAK
jgi:hypothetical protein